VQGRNTRKRAKPQDAALMKQAVYAVKQMTLVTVKLLLGTEVVGIGRPARNNDTTAEIATWALPIPGKTGIYPKYSSFNA